MTRTRLAALSLLGLVLAGCSASADSKGSASEVKTIVGGQDLTWECKVWQQNYDGFQRIGNVSKMQEYARKLLGGPSPDDNCPGW